MSRAIPVYLSGAVGFVAGGVLPNLTIWDEFFRRLSFAMSGGAGETADWGQPLFFGIVMGIVPACLCAVLLAVVVSTLLPKDPDKSDA